MCLMNSRRPAQSRSRESPESKTPALSPLTSGHCHKMTACQAYASEAAKSPDEISPDPFPMVADEPGRE